MKKYNGPSIRNGKTATGKLSDSIGFSRTNGVTRVLTAEENASQRKSGLIRRN